MKFNLSYYLIFVLRKKIDGKIKIAREILYFFFLKKKIYSEFFIFTIFIALILDTSQTEPKKKTLIAFQIISKQEMSDYESNQLDPSHTSTKTAQTNHPPLD